MTCLKVCQALSKMNMTSGLVVVMTLLLVVPKVSAHTNHPHNRDTEQSTPEAVVESSDGDDTTVTAPVKQDTDVQSQEDQSQSLTPPVNTAEVSRSISVPFGEILLGLIVAVPPLLISSRKRLHSK